MYWAYKQVIRFVCVERQSVMLSALRMRRNSLTVVVELVCVVVLCTLVTRLCTAATDRKDNYDDDLLAELDLLLPTSGDNIQVTNIPSIDQCVKQELILQVRWR